jgi:hypothetical protein
MPNAQQSMVPTLGTIMDLARAYVNDSYPGLAGTSGRILTNGAPFTIPYINSALRTVNRKLRNEGVTYPIKDNVILNNLTPVANADPSIQVYVSFDGYFDGMTMHASPRLPSDCMQVFDVWEQTFGSNLPFAPMVQPEGGLPSAFQGANLGVWEWRQDYRIYMIGSINTKNLRLRYLSGQPPFAATPADFDTTPVNIIDCEEAMAYAIALQYARARGADPSLMQAGFDDAIAEMASEWVRRQQTVNYRRPAYEGAGSTDQGSSVSPTGSIQGV